MKIVALNSRTPYAKIASYKMKFCRGKYLSRMREFSSKYGTGYIRAMREKGWQQPGKMFDELGELFKVNRRLLILGDSEDISRAYRKVDFIGTPVDAIAISAQELLASPAITMEISKKTCVGYTLLVVYQNPEVRETVIQSLVQMGRHFVNVNIFSERSFLGELADRPEVYCGIFSVYTTGKVYIIHDCMLTTTICNLNCEYCLNYTPYIKKAKHFSLEDLKRSADIYFSHVDRVGLLQLTGGEPLLYPHIQDILEYISRNYGDRIAVLNLVTNGTIIPSDSFCDFLAEHKILVDVDNYSVNVPKVEPTLTKVINKLKEKHVDHIVITTDEFMKTFPPLSENMSLDESGLVDKFTRCFPGFQNILDGKLCSCLFHSFAVNAGLIPDSADAWFDINKMSESELDKKALVEFRLGFNKKGYVDWCRYCNGHITTINTLVAPAAQQAEGHLEWDVDHPTFMERDET